MAIIGAYEENGLVVIEFRDHPPVKLHWRKAIERCRAISESESQLSLGRRALGIQKAVEEVIAASRVARKKDPEQGSWSPSRAVSMFIPASKQAVLARKRPATGPAV